MSDYTGKLFIYNNLIKEIEEFEKYNFKEGKSLYEVIRIINGIPLFLNQHIERLFNSSKIMNLNISMKNEDIVKNIKNIININNIKEGNIKLVFNYSLRVLQNKEKMHINAIDGCHKENKENFLVYVIKHNYPNKEEYINGVHTILYYGERNNPNAKVINNEFRKKVNEEIKNNNAYEAILVDHIGNITEGSKSNIFMVKGEEVWTSPTENVLPGITRQIIMEVCKSLNIVVKEVKVSEKELNNINGLFISGTSPKVLPINSIGKTKFSSSENLIIKKIMETFNEFIEKDIQKFSYC